MKLTEERSLEAAMPIQMIGFYALLLDVEYLKQALRDIKEHASKREAMLILHPSPFTAGQEQDLLEAKIVQLELMIKLSENSAVLKKIGGDLQEAHKTAGELAKLFQF